MVRQSSSCVVMVRPDHFGFNAQTAETNPFQHTPQSLHKNSSQITEAALEEFEDMVAGLRKEGIEVIVLPSISSAVTPDAVFPNNWFSHHADGKLIYYPLLVKNRRQERQTPALLHALQDYYIPVSQEIDTTSLEEEGLFLESTGSMVLDRVHKVAFAMESARTGKKAFDAWCALMEYEGVYITIPQRHQMEVYHTNVNMTVGTDFAIICLDVIENASEREKVTNKLKELRKEMVAITLEQVYSFCGNVLELQTKNGEKKIAMSTTAYKAFTSQQLATLERFGKPVAFSIPTIEQVGGGGVRCMLAEVFPA